MGYRAKFFCNLGVANAINSRLPISPEEWGKKYQHCKEL